MSGSECPRGRLAPIVDRATVSNSSSLNVGMLDGSLRFVKDSVSLATWGAIATKAGGEVVSADGF